MQKSFSFVFDIGEVLFTRQVSIDVQGNEQVSFIPITEGLTFLEECHGVAERTGGVLIACTNLKKDELALLQELFPDTVAFFKGIVSPDRALFKKPDPRIFEYVLIAYDLIPHQTLFFDDTIRNVEAAQSVGIQGVWIDDWSKVREKVRRHIPAFGLNSGA